MKFDHLDEVLLRDNENLARFLSVSERLKEPTRTILSRTLDIASYLNKNLLGEDYIVFGGYGVLSHLMQDNGEEIATSWRGSEDIDMAGTLRALRAIKRAYPVISDFPSPNLADKRTIRLKEGNSKECKIDFYTGHFEDRFFPPEVNNHFGVELRVSSPLCLIRGKLFTPPQDPVHAIDITRLLAVLEHRGNSPQDVARYFSADQKLDLLNRLREGYEIIRAGVHETDVLPSRNFKEKIEKLLHKGRAVR